MSDDVLAALGLDKAQQDASEFADSLRQSGEAPPMSRMDLDIENARLKYKGKQLEEYINRLRGKVIDRKVEEISRSTVVKFGEGDRYNEIAARAQLADKFEGWRTGIAYVDDALRGIRGGEVTVLSGAANIGKTMLALNIAASICVNARKSVLFITLEMSLEKIEERLYQMATVKDHRWLMQYLSLQENRKVGVSELKRMLQSGRYDLVVVDHLQFLARRSEGVGDYEKISNTTGAVHDMALDFKLPVFLISQTNRESTKKTGLMGMHDAKGSGSIEYDCDNFISINRDAERLLNDQIIVRLEKMRKKADKRIYQRYKLLTWNGAQLANNGAYEDCRIEG